MNKIILGCLGMAAFVAVSCTAAAASLTREQGDAILKELREIKELLARQAADKPNPADAPRPVAVRDQPLRFELTDVPSLGSSDAPVTIVAFVDYQCPYCRKYQADVFPGLRKRYIETGKVRYFVSNLPLQALHANALLAAEAALCAGEQGGFWKLHEKLLEHEAKLDRDSLLEYAQGVGLDAPRFWQCLESHRFADRVKQELDQVKQIGLSGTPSFIVGKVVSGAVVGPTVIGAQPMEAFEQKVREASGG